MKEQRPAPCPSARGLLRPMDGNRWALWAALPVLSVSEPPTSDGLPAVLVAATDFLGGSLVGLDHHAS